MNHFHVIFGVPQAIQHGLDSGVFERVGGVIRHTQNKQIVAWLREAGNPLPITPLAAPLVRLGAAASMLNLGLTAMGFAVVLARLSALEQRLRQVQQVLVKMEQKIDLAFYANFRTGLDLVSNALTLEHPDHRKASAFQAVNRLIEAEHHYSALVDDHLQQIGPVADEYLLTVMLAYTAEVRCYLELDEHDKAYHRLQEGEQALRPRVEQYVTQMLTPNPAIYLQPALKQTVSLQRLTAIYQWLDPSLDAAAVFEQVRDGCFAFNPNSDRWIKTLPRSIWHSKAAIPRKEAFKPLWDIRFDDDDKSRRKVYPYILQALGVMEGMIESYRRFEGYRMEIVGIQQHNLTFHDWQQGAVRMKSQGEEGQIVCVIPAQPIPIP
jgi:hypothetical protein